MAGPREPGLKHPQFTSAGEASRVLVRLAIAGGLLAYLAESGMIDARALSRPFTAWPIALIAVSLVLIDVSLMALRFPCCSGPSVFPLPGPRHFN